MGASDLMVLDNSDCGDGKFCYLLKWLLGKEVIVTILHLSFDCSFS